jgi:hypothetical protein
MALAGYDPGERANYQYVVVEIDARGRNELGHAVQGLVGRGHSCSTILLFRSPPHGVVSVDATLQGLQLPVTE